MSIVCARILLPTLVLCLWVCRSYTMLFRPTTRIQSAPMAPHPCTEKHPHTHTRSRTISRKLHRAESIANSLSLGAFNRSTTHRLTNVYMYTTIIDLSRLSVYQLSTTKTFRIQRVYIVENPRRGAPKTNSSNTHSLMASWQTRQWTQAIRFQTVGFQMVGRE